MKIAICPGSFDPITFGHLDVIERTSETLDKLIVGVTINPSKKPMFSAEERVELIKKSVEHLSNVEVVSFTGLLVDYMKLHNVERIVKGLRNFSDFEYEYQMAELNRRLYSKAETYFVMTDNKYAIISSRMVKSLAEFNGPIDDFVPQHVKEAIHTKIKKV